MANHPGIIVRREAVAGAFYPAGAQALRENVGALLAEAPAPAGTHRPKAVIVPHAGYMFSGPVAARAYAALAEMKGLVQRVVLIGPSHFKAFRGIAAPSVDCFETPIGPVALDRASIDGLVGDGLVLVDDDAHRDEHALEVQLPFLIAQLGDFRLVPLVVGDAPEEAVAAALDAVWGGPETLIVVSSDLSHYHSPEVAEKLDFATAEAIERMDGDVLTGEHACGYQAIAGLLAVARRRGLAIERLDLRNSGDVAGGRGQVVGYGAWSLAAS